MSTRTSPYRAEGRPELVQEPGGLRFYVGGQSIHAGYIVILNEASWRFEWSFRKESPVLLYAASGPPIQISTEDFQLHHVKLPRLWV